MTSDGLTDERDRGLTDERDRGLTDEREPVIGVLEPVIGVLEPVIGVLVHVSVSWCMSRCPGARLRVRLPVIVNPESAITVPPSHLQPSKTVKCVMYVVYR